MEPIGATRSVFFIMESTYKEAQAFASVRTPYLLGCHLNMMRKMLPFSQRIAFYHPQVDAAHRMLCSDDGRMVLVWQLRDNPYLEPSEANIQSTAGTVYLYHVDPLASNERIAKAIDQQLRRAALRLAKSRLNAQPLLAAVA